MLDEQLGEEAREGNVRKVAELLSLGANVNASLDDVFKPLLGAALNGHLEVCKLLLSKGASVSKSENGWSLGCFINYTLQKKKMQYQYAPLMYINQI